MNQTAKRHQRIRVLIEIREKLKEKQLSDDIIKGQLDSYIKRQWALSYTSRLDYLSVAMDYPTASKKEDLYS